MIMQIVIWRCFDDNASSMRVITARCMTSTKRNHSASDPYSMTLSRKRCCGVAGHRLEKRHSGVASGADSSASVRVVSPMMSITGISNNSNMPKIQENTGVGWRRRRRGNNIRPIWRIVLFGGYLPFRWLCTVMCFVRI